MLKIVRIYLIHLYLDIRRKTSEYYVLFTGLYMRTVVETTIYVIIQST